MVAILAGAVAFIALQRATADRAGEDMVAIPVVEVVVATQAIPLRTQLTTEFVELQEIPVDSVPEGAVRELEEAIGMVTLVDLYPGEIILAQRLLDPNVITAGGRYALFMLPDEVLMAFPASDLMSKVGVLKPGDHIDLLYTMSFPGGGEDEENVVTFTQLQNVVIAAIVGDPAEPTAYLFTLSPQDALVLKYTKDAGAILDIVLRAPGAEQPFDTEPVDVDFLMQRFRILR